VTDGISILPTLIGDTAAGGQQRTHDFLYWEFHERGFQHAARMGKWKGVLLKQGGKLELYDLESDLGEDRDVADEHAEIVARIEAYLKAARSENPDWPIRANPPAKAKTRKARTKPAQSA
jgi:hypothetical protein